MEFPSQKRQSSSCPGEQFTSPNGLDFTPYCGMRVATGAQVIWATKEDSLEICMDSCSVWRPRCYGVSYNVNTGICSRLDKGIAASNLARDDTTHVAIAKSSQLQSPADTSCPYGDRSFQVSASGEQFIIICDLDMPYSDYCSWTTEPNGCEPHADSLAECLEICSTAHPLCKGVSWNPDMIAGFGNCYLKLDPNSGTPAPPIGNFVVHSAEVTPEYETVGVVCPTDLSYTSPNKLEFNIECYQSRAGSQNITSFHQIDLKSCMDDCSSHQTDNCVGVVFDISMDLGYENCYLLNATGSPNPGANATFAELVQKGSTGTTQSGSKQSSGNKTWIAGAVVGPLVLIMIVIGILYWRRRSSRKKQKDVHHVAPRYLPTELHDSPAQKAPLMTEAVAEIKGTPLHEMRDPKAEDMLVHELGDGSDGDRLDRS